MEYKGVDDETDDILARWERTLDLLERKDFTALSRQVDWVAKKGLVDICANDERKVEVDKLRSIDLMYSAIDKEESLFYALQDQGCMDRIVSDEEIKEATFTPPRDTRAWCRGNLVGKRIITSIDWEEVDTKYGYVSLDDPFNQYEKKLKRVLTLHNLKRTNTFKKERG